MFAVIINIKYKIVGIGFNNDRCLIRGPEFYQVFISVFECSVSFNPNALSASAEKSVPD